MYLHDYNYQIHKSWPYIHTQVTTVEQFYTIYYSSATIRTQLQFGNVVHVELSLIPLG